MNIKKNGVFVGLDEHGEEIYVGMANSLKSIGTMGIGMGIGMGASMDELIEAARDSTGKVRVQYGAVEPEEPVDAGKFGVVKVIGLSDMSQLKEIYGNKVVDAVIANTQTKLNLKGN